MSRSAKPQLVLGVVTSRWGVLLVHRPGLEPPAFFPAGEPAVGEQPGDTAVRGVAEEARLRVRAVRVLGRHPHPVTRRPVVYVAATPLKEVTRETVSQSVQIGWYTLEQLELLFPELHPPVREHLEATIPTR